MKWLLFLAACPLAAQITLTGVAKQFSPCNGTVSGGTGDVACTQTQREQLPSPPPSIVAVQETGSEPDTITIGPITCNPGHFRCYNINATLCRVTNAPEPCSATTTVSPGNDAEIRIHNDGFDTIGVNAPFATATLTIPVKDSHQGSYTITLTYRIVNLTPPEVKSPSGSFVNCSFSSGDGPYPNGFFMSPNVCSNPPNLNPTGGAVVRPPGLGENYQDYNFGGTVTVDMPFVAGGRANTGTMRIDGYCDSITSCLNADGTLFVTDSLPPWGSGLVYITYTSKSGNTGDAYANPPGITSAWSWSAMNSHRYFYTENPNKIHQVDLVFPPPAACATAWIKTTCGTDTIIYSDITADATSISNGGDGQVSKDDWWGLTINRASGHDPVVILVNLNNPDEEHYYGAWPLRWSGRGYTRRSTVTSPGINSATNERYLLVGAVGSLTIAIYAYNTDTHTLAFKCFGPEHYGNWEGGPGYYHDGPACSTADEAAQKCLQIGHLALGEDCSTGECVEYLIYDLNGDAGFSGLYLNAMRLDAGDAMATAIEDTAGGGFYGIAGTGGGDYHIGCATSAPVCALSSGSAQDLTSFRIGSLSGNGVSPIHIVENAADRVQYDGIGAIIIGGAFGNTLLNGTVCTPSNYVPGPPAAFDCAGTGNGSWVPGTGAFAKNIPQPISSGNGEIILLDLRALHLTRKAAYTRLARTMQGKFTNINPPLIDYYNQTHANISGDGTVIGWTTNFGIPEQNCAVDVLTGFTSHNRDMRRR